MSGKREALAEDALSGFIGITPLARGAFRCCLLPLESTASHEIPRASEVLGISKKEVRTYLRMIEARVTVLMQQNQEESSVSAVGGKGGVLAKPLAPPKTGCFLLDLLLVK